MDIHGIAITSAGPGSLNSVVFGDNHDELVDPATKRFKRDNPDIELRLNVNHGEVDFVRDKISIAIRTSMFRAPQDVVIRDKVNSTQNNYIELKMIGGKKLGRSYSGQQGWPASA